MKRRILSVLLALCMLAAIPMTGFAEEASATAEGIIMEGSPAGLTRTADGSILITDTQNNVIWQMNADGEISLLAGSFVLLDSYGNTVGAHVDGALTEAFFNQPWAIVPFLDGYAISDRGNNAIRYLTDDRVQTLLLAEKLEGISTFTGLTTDTEGSLYFSDVQEGKLWKYTKDETLSLYAEGLDSPMGLCWQNGILYVAEAGLNRISAIEDGELTVICGTGEDGYRDGSAAQAAFSAPQALTVTEDGTIYIADTCNGAIRCCRSGIVTTLQNSAEELWGAKPCGLLVFDNMLLGADNLTGGLFYFYLENKTFSDVASTAWYAEEVRSAAALGLMRGTDQGFEPETELSRAMMAQILLNIAKMQDRDLIVYGTADFADVQESDWFYSAVGWAQRAGLVKGRGEGLFAPNETVTRQELAVVLYRLMGGKPGAAAALDSFQDSDRVADWAEDAMVWAVEQGILQGDGGLLMPENPVNRAQTAAILVRLCTKS